MGFSTLKQTKSVQHISFLKKESYFILSFQFLIGLIIFQMLS